jgi:hypothetical protein
LELEQQNLDAYSILIYNTKSASTRGYYLRRLKIFFDFIELIPEKSINERCNYFAEKGKENVEWAFSNIIRFLQFQRERVENGEITSGTLKNYWKPIKLLCESANVNITSKRITRGLPKVRRYADDRAPTLEEIRKISEYPERRMKAIVYTMASSGIRIGAWDYLRWGHINPITKEKDTLAKVIVYAGDEEEYYTFISPEAYTELKKWMDYRKSSGEEINEKSWVMRHLWNAKRGRKFGLITAPKKLKSNGVRGLIEDALWTQDIRKKSQIKGNRYEFQANHGFRKWFKTRCEIAGMKSINIEILMGHSIGISDSYYRITESELLEEYLKVMNFLTIQKENQLQTQLKLIEEKDKENTFLIKGKLKEKDEEIGIVKDELNILKQQMKSILNIIQVIDSEDERELLSKKMILHGIYKPSQK